MPSPHFVGLQSYYCPDSPSSQKPTLWSGRREAGCLLGVGVLLKGRKGGCWSKGVCGGEKAESINPKYLLNRPKTGRPGSKWVTFMLPDMFTHTKKGNTVRNARLHRVWHWHWMDVDMHWQFLKQRSVKRRAEQRCRPLRRLDPVFFTVNPQWSHQHWYESGCKKKSLAFLWIGQSCWSSLLQGGSNTNAGFLDIYFSKPFFPPNWVVLLSLLLSPSSADTSLPFNSLPHTTKKHSFLPKRFPIFRRHWRWGCLLKEK